MKRVFRNLELAVMVILLVVFWVAAANANKNPPAHNPPYPERWWAPVDDPKKPAWEILPQEAGFGEVILSKRNELGVLSNFASTTFVYHGRKYASVEGFWQATKFPEGAYDPRAKAVGIIWTHTRAQVEQMTAFEAKHAGDEGSTNMQKMRINWVSFEGKHLVYREEGDSPFYRLILEAMHAKLDQTQKVREILFQTGDLILRPDHHVEAGAQKAWRYYEIWMRLRQEEQREAASVALE